MKVAILGGTFNPPHFGHMFLANEVRNTLGYDRIVFIPSNIPAHKETNISSNNRLEMVRIITKDYEWADCSSCDIQRGGVTRSVDTIRDIKKKYNLKNKPGFIIGDDLLPGFTNWKNPNIICKEAELIVATRDSIDKSIYNFQFKEINNRVFPLSSSEIRDRVTKNLDIDFLLPTDVIEYIKRNELYR